MSPTSADIRAAHLTQRLVPPAYELAMRRLNDRFTAVARASAAETPTR